MRLTFAFRNLMLILISNLQVKPDKVFLYRGTKQILQGEANDFFQIPHYEVNRLIHVNQFPCRGKMKWEHKEM